MSRLARLSLCAALISFVAVPAQAQVLYGSAFAGPDSIATLYTIDPTSGTATPAGSIGFERCGAMDVSAFGIIYAACERPDDTPVLVTVNPMTGAGTEIGPTGISGSVSDLSFRGDGTLFAYDADNDPEHTIYTIDTATGAATLVGDTGLQFAGGNGMSFDLGGTLFHSQVTSGPNPDLNVINPVTGVASLLGQLDDPNRLNAMDVNPFTGVMYGVLNLGSSGSAAALATLDTTTMTVTTIGSTTAGMDALAWGLGAPVPSLPTVALLLLMLALAGITAARLGRRPMGTA